MFTRRTFWRNKRRPKWQLASRLEWDRANACQMGRIGRPGRHQTPCNWPDTKVKENRPRQSPASSCLRLRRLCWRTRTKTKMMTKMCSHRAKRSVVALRPVRPPNWLLCRMSSSTWFEVVGVYVLFVSFTLSSTENVFLTVLAHTHTSPLVSVVWRSWSPK